MKKEEFLEASIVQYFNDLRGEGAISCAMLLSLVPVAIIHQPEQHTFPNLVLLLTAPAWLPIAVAGLIAIAVLTRVPARAEPVLY